MSALYQLAWRPRFAKLGTPYSQVCAATPLPAVQLVASNPALAAELGLPADWAGAQTTAEVLAGNLPLPASPPLASLYAGHQFGQYVPQLGDGRALLIGELQAPGGQHWELQLKGAGPTPFSRRGDGRAVLRSTIREYLCSEAMAGLGIPTTRALAIVASPLPVYRETVENAAVLSRLAESFIRFGSFEVFFYRGEIDSLRQLADFVIDHYYPACRDAADPYLALLSAVIGRTASLVAAWQTVGFCHGVMNSDNMSILGLTLDYGPFGFLDGYDPGRICNHSDDSGRYAYDQQPQIGLWNLHCLAQALLPLTERDAVLAALAEYQPQFEAALAEAYRRKLGLLHWQDDDWSLLGELLQLLAAARSDYTRFFRALCACPGHGAASPALRDSVLDREGFDAWLRRYQQRLQQDGQDDVDRQAAQRAANPKYILRNHLAELAIRAAQAGDYSEINRLQQLLADPYAEQPDNEAYAALPPDWASALSVSCSS